MFRNNFLNIFILLLVSLLLPVFNTQAEESCPDEPLTDKTMVAWVSPSNLDQRGVSVLSLDMANPDAFDAIVLGEHCPATWMPGSSYGLRTETEQESWPRETCEPDSFVQVAIVYCGPRITIYRNGVLYADYETAGAMQEYNHDAMVLIGPRHFAGKSGHFAGRVQDVRIYRGALAAATLAELKPGENSPELLPWFWLDFTNNTMNDRTGQWPIIETRGDVTVQDGALCLGLESGTLCALAKERSLAPEVESEKKYVSKMPHCTFPETLPEQLKALQENPLLQSFVASRAELSENRLWPRYHMTPPVGRSGDPNGLSFYQGRWHLFYQFFAQSVFEGDILWGHAVSDDLVHWRDLPPALYRGPEENCWSGGVCIDGDRAIAAYYGNLLGGMVAVSDDPLLLNWEKVTGTAVIPLPKEPVDYNVFDSCIWKEGDKYYILSGGCQNKGASKNSCNCPACSFLNAKRQLQGESGVQRPGMYLFESTDLAHWTYLHQFVEDDYVSRNWDDGACPYFWPIGDQSNPETARSLLLHFSHTTGGKYLIGRYDREAKKFYVQTGENFNHGAVGPNGLHAPTAYPDGKGGVITIFNVNSDDKAPVPGCVMSLPLQMNLLEQDQLGMKPVSAVESLRYDPVHMDSRLLPSNYEIVLKNVRGRSAEFDFVLEPQQTDAIEIKVLRSSDDEEYTRIVLYPNRGYRSHGVGPKDWPGYNSVVDLDSSHSSLMYSLKRPTEQAQVYTSEGEPVRIRVFVDRSIVEVFVNDRQILVVRVYPSRDDSDGVSIRAVGGDAQLQSLDAWQMKEIFPTTID